MLWHIVGAALSVFDVYVITSFYYIRLKKQTSIKVIIAFSIICVIANYCLFLFNISEFLIIISSVILCFLISFMFKASWKEHFFYPMVITSLGIVAEMIVGLLLGAIYGIPVSEITSDPSSLKFLTGTITSKFIFFIFMRILCRIYVMDDYTLPLRHWLLIMAVPITSTVICIGLAFSVKNCIMNDYGVSFWILAGMLGINIQAFWMYDVLSTQAKSLIDHERARSLMESEKRRYDTIISQSKELASLLHDTQLHNDAIYDLLLAENNSAAFSYVKNLRKKEFRLDHVSYTQSSNAAIKAILRRKITEANKNAIKVLSNLSIEFPLPIDEISLCLIVGNALDNAIEACRYLPEDKRLIDINMCYVNDRLTIRIANTSNHVEIKNNICQTTKKNTLLHGYGLKNIQKAVSDIGGNSVIRYIDGMFIIGIIFLL